jgi:hypothetical protein
MACTPLRTSSIAIQRYTVCPGYNQTLPRGDSFNPPSNTNRAFHAAIIDNSIMSPCKTPVHLSEINTLALQGSMAGNGGTPPKHILCDVVKAKYFYL